MTPDASSGAGPATMHGLAKTPSSISGLDDVLKGGFPTGRATLVCGGPGTGKTLMGTEFLVNGIRHQGERAVLVSFEESAQGIIENAASLGFDLAGLIDSGDLIIDAVEIASERSPGTGAFDLDGLFIRIGHAIDKIGAKRIVLDTIENLFHTSQDQLTIRSELHRLFEWLKEKQVTAIVTAEKGENSLTRHGIEEYVSDCVLSLDQNIIRQVATRRLHVVKYRGSAHGTNIYPFVLDEEGFTVVPITSASLHRGASTERISLGIPGLDEMLGGKGPYRGNTIFVTGTAGTGKTTVAAHAADAACARGERCIFYSYEQAADAIMRDTGELGKRLKKWVDKGLLRFEGSRPGSQGLDAHLAKMRRNLRSFRPHLVVLDPITGFGPIGDDWETKNMLILLLDTVAEVGATVVMTSLVHGSASPESTSVGVTSLADAWILLHDLAEGDRRVRGIQVRKSRGIANSDQVHRFKITPDGVTVLTGERTHGSDGDDDG